VRHARIRRRGRVERWLFQRLHPGQVLHSPVIVNADRQHQQARLRQFADLLRGLVAGRADVGRYEPFRNAPHLRIGGGASIPGTTPGGAWTRGRAAQPPAAPGQSLQCRGTDKRSPRECASPTASGGTLSRCTGSRTETMVRRTEHAAENGRRMRRPRPPLHRSPPLDNSERPWNTDSSTKKATARRAGGIRFPVFPIAGRRMPPARLGFCRAGIGNATAVNDSEYALFRSRHVSVLDTCKGS
jgi:hypothetical protein